MKDIRQSLEYAKYLQSTGWLTERVKEVNYFIKTLPLIGSFIKLQRPENIDPAVLKTLFNKYKVFQVIIEPKEGMHEDWFKANGFKQSNSSYLPSKTLILELSRPKDELFNFFAKDAKRAILKNSGVSIFDSSNDIDKFFSAWKKAVGWKRHVVNLKNLVNMKKFFKDNCLMLLSSESNSGAIFLIDNNCAYYWQAFTDKPGRKSQVQYNIVWEGVLWAKQNRAKLFDFEGVYDERFPDKSWKGFTHFKKSFGGYEVKFPGCFIKTNIFGIK